MRKMLLFGLVLGLAGASSRLARADCPGISACVYNSGCPRGAQLVQPGQSIQRAIDAAPAGGETLCVAPGTYSGLINFRGKAVNLVSSGGPDFTILDGGGAGSVVTFATGEGKNSILDGFTVRNGTAIGGGGISIFQASPTIRNSIVTENSAVGSHARGGGMSVAGAQASPAITCTVFLKNRADYAGGGLISGYSATPYLRSDLFQENTASYGGGIGVYYSGRLDLGWTELLANQAWGDGRGIHAGVPYGNLLVRQVWFLGNTASGSGGGMWVPGGLAEVLNSTFDGNSAWDGGAIAAGYGSMLSVASTLFVRNITGSSGSAALINSWGPSASVVNHYNGFFGNTVADFRNTDGNVGMVTLPSFGTSCCPAAGSPAIDAGVPDYFFNDADGSRGDIGACGGPALSMFGPLR